MINQYVNCDISLACCLHTNVYIINILEKCIFFSIKKLEKASITKLAGAVTILLIDLTFKML